MPNPFKDSKAQKRARLRAERRQAQQIVSQYQGIWQSVKADLADLGARIKAARAAGETIDKGWLVKQHQLSQIQAQVEGEILVATSFLETALAQAQFEAVLAGRADAEQLIRDSLGPPPPGVKWQPAIPVAATNHLIGYSSDGQPLGQLLATLAPDAAEGLRKALVSGIALGKNPTVIARDARDSLGGNMARALTIARTEILRSYRESSRATYQDNADVVTGWVWSAELDETTCEVCWAMNGEVFDTEVEMDTHPNAVLAGSTFVPYGPLRNMVAARYSGPAMRIFAGSEVLTIGPNHPILTRRGMVPAYAICEGDELVYDLRIDQAQTWNEPDLKDVPLLEDAFQTLTASSTSTRVTSAGSNFHGDRVFCEGKVHVVEPDRQLLPILDSCGIEQFREVGFMLADMELAFKASRGTADLRLDAVDLASSGGMGGSSSWGAHHIFLPVHGVLPTHYAGWAFDSSTDSSLYCNDGFVVSNCRCSLVPQTVSWADLGYQDVPETTVQVESGPELFAAQPDSVQLAVLGPGKYAAYKAGQITLPDLVQKTYSAQWGGGRRARSLSSALEHAKH